MDITTYWGTYVVAVMRNVKQRIHFREHSHHESVFDVRAKADAWNAKEDILYDQKTQDCI